MKKAAGLKSVESDKDCGRDNDAGTKDQSRNNPTVVLSHRTVSLRNLPFFIDVRSEAGQKARQDQGDDHQQEGP